MSLDTVHNLWEYLLTNLGFKIIKILLIIIFFFIIRSISKKAVEVSFKKYQEKKENEAARIHTIKKMVTSIVSYVLGFIMIVMLFTILGLPISSLLAGAGIVGLAIGFGAQGLVSDIVTGFFILLEKQMDVGEVVDISGYSGVVEDIGLRTTQLRGFDGSLHFIPNRNIVDVNNHSRGNMQALVDISISYNENIDKAISVIRDVCQQFSIENSHIVEGPDVIGVQAFNSSDIVLRVIAQTKNGEQLGVERELKKAIKEAFDENNIESPFAHFVLFQKQEEA